ncbi:MAG TPA: urea carboxylase-associated family protein [Candidatus Binatia bacterium]|jgi:hypothetical protein|nr:urea carboxylase-associated family protein [Candidatus Binatia bacterium]
MAANSSPTQPGRLIERQVVPPGQGASGKVAKGQILRITDVEGEQVADFCSFSLDDPAEYCDVVYTTFAKRSWKVGEGDVIYTREMRPLWTITRDTAGVHYWGGGFCSRALNRFVGVDQHGCRDTITEQLAAHELSALYVSPSSCFNVFMNFPYGADGRWEILRPVTRPGDHIDLRAEMPVLWAVSVCHFPGACNGDRPTPLQFELFDAR